VKFINAQKNKNEWFEQGQSTVEYIILIGIVVGAFIAVKPVLKEIFENKLNNKINVNNPFKDKLYSPVKP
jgi:hypothetical protein